MLEGKSVSYKNELLFSRGINYDSLPSWQKRGIGIWKENYEKKGFNPITGETTVAVRTRNRIEYELPLGNEYSELIKPLFNFKEAE